MSCWEKMRNSLFCIKLVRSILVGFWMVVAITSSHDVYATDSTISIAMNSNVELPLSYNEFNSTDLDISVSTSGVHGYIVTLETRGTSTDLISEIDDSYTIPTITLPNGAASITSSGFSTGYGYSTDGINYKPAPAIGGEGDIMWQTEYPSPDVADEYTLTFGAKVENEDMISGGYVGTFIITAISDGVQECAAGNICYYGGAANAVGEMEPQPATSNTSVMLTAPNYSRPGYGFVGWSVNPDGSGTIYGPNETITTGNLSEEGLKLYAKWVGSTGTLQGWSGCPSMSIGEYTALTDSRDGNVYTVARLADGQCWMTENLRLDLSNLNLVLNAENTNNPTTSFVSAVDSHPPPVSSFCADNSSSCFEQINYNSGTTNNYSYGNYYNWYTATAGNGKYATSSAGQKAAGDICPVGWHLPSGYGNSGDLAKLHAALKAGVSDLVAAGKWRAYPNNFMLSGQYKADAPTSYRESGNYHSSTTSNATSANNLWIQQNQVRYSSNGSAKSNGQSVRCMISNDYTIKFDKNTSQQVTGSMSDQEVTHGVSATLNANQYSIGLVGRTGYYFASWNTKADGTGTTYADQAQIINLAAVGATITLYAQWEVVNYVDVTVAFQPNEVVKVELKNSVYGNQTVTTNGGVALIAPGHSYRVTLEANPEYDLDSWATSANGTLSSETAAVTNYTVTGDATLTVNTKRRDGKLYLQRVSLAVCPTEATTAIDARDEKEYTIQRLADGKCWMLDNLRLNPSDLVTSLSYENTNIAEDSSFVLPSSGFSSSYTDPKIDASREDTVQTSFDVGSGKVGIYYNYCAATAGTLCSNNSTAKATYDICPVGWRLPNGVKSTGEYKALYASYGNSPSNLRTAFAVPLTGYLDASRNAVTNFGSNTYIWSNAAYNSNKSYSLSVTTSSVNAEFGGLRANGFPVRCVLD